jgi:hypothetical protein
LNKKKYHERLNMIEILFENKKITFTYTKDEKKIDE